MPAKRSASAASVLAITAGRRAARARLCIRLAAPLSFVLLLVALLRTQPLTAPPTAPPPITGPAKVAFLFLVRSGVPLDLLWDAFFRNGEDGKFSVYVHSAPGFKLDRTTTGSPYFDGRQLAKSVKVEWGEPTMVEAERMLFAAALEDPTNQRFVLLSDSFVDKTEMRYNPSMSPAIPKDKWRKGSQMVVTKALFGQKPNYRRLGFGLWRKQKGATRMEHDCIPDEHYVQTLFSGIDRVNYQMEHRTEWCQCNGTPAPCFVFARKFSYSAAMHLLEAGAVGPLKSAQLV
ncbi:hypothetical protein GUJ93_ZPchr0007g4434 [Zizania palustris]|uniref:Core-2/I-branching beta-16-N-acetylglucosaminyltransferase family protein n=1 Tax=Zizania palustris TaxID=103762 RepID=A0A8J5T811_ZIZPA|nr:hypothetical protein GUJ93_ZPchr0007g4434 [Zizania palustris]